MLNKWCLASSSNRKHQYKDRLWIRRCHLPHLKRKILRREWPSPKRNMLLCVYRWIYRFIYRVFVIRCAVWSFFLILVPVPFTLTLPCWADTHHPHHHRRRRRRRHHHLSTIYFVDIFSLSNEQHYEFCFKFRPKSNNRITANQFHLGPFRFSSSNKLMDDE